MSDDTKQHSKWWLPLALAVIALVPSSMTFLLSKNETEQRSKFNYETSAKQITAIQEVVVQLDETVTEQNLKIAKLEGRCDERAAYGPPTTSRSYTPPPPVSAAPRIPKAFKPPKADYNSAYQEEQMKK